MLVGFERESASKDVGIRTFGLTSLLGAVSVLISPAYGLVAMVGVIVLVALLNARSLVANHSLEITTSAALLVTYALGALVGLGPQLHTRRSGDPDDPAACVESGTAPICRRSDHG